MEYIVDLSQLTTKDLARVGGKNAALGELISNLAQCGVVVPPGFATTTAAYWRFLKQDNLDKFIFTQLAKLPDGDLRQLGRVSREIRDRIWDTEFEPNFIKEVEQAYRHLVGRTRATLAVRSSATAEDLPDASFAGQHDSFLNVSGIQELLVAIKGTYASLFHERAITYRRQHGFAHPKVAISAGVQLMVRSDLGASGVMFTLDTESGFDQVVLINAAWGLGESVVQGAVNPDEFYLYKPALQNNLPAILQRNLGTKMVKVVYNGAGGTKAIKTVDGERINFCISDRVATKLAKMALAIEAHYQQPMDIEWAQDGRTGKLYIVQARPETVRSREQHDTIERFRLEQTASVITSGRSIGQKIGQGKACIIDHPRNMGRMEPGQVLVADKTDPDWEPIMKQAQAIVTNRGGRTCHAAIVARELGIPAIVGCQDATTKIKNREAITVSCASGEIGKVYRGLLPITIDHVKVTEIPQLPIKLCMNLADPSRAFSYQYLPNCGVGLVRLEFIIGNVIGIHPQALLSYQQLPSGLKRQLAKRIAGYLNPQEFYIEKLREGIATIAAAFFPKSVIVRFSDFKSNEYANLLGGKQFEPIEENPMLGFRGGSRYLSQQFVDCFGLECEALQRVRKMGLTNVQVMLPFVRTVAEAEELIALLAHYGIHRRGSDGWKVLLMCEIPANVILAQEFLALCDGFSIGSNDLTQLTLGLDRDSDLVAHRFDERNAAVKQLIHQVIGACKQAKKYIGICGQAPSDYPEFAQWLIAEGIDAISLTPDAIVETALYLSSQPSGISAMDVPNKQAGDALGKSKQSEPRCSRVKNLKVKPQKRRER